MMEDQWTIAKYNPQWRTLFLETAARLRASLGDIALRIDHIGSTSIRGLDAKPVIDIQISVSRLEDLPRFKSGMEQLGFVFREENPDRTKRYFREAPGTRRTHIHVRQAGSFSEQVNLLFRDYLRQHPEDCLRYSSEKRRLMKLYKHDRIRYVEGKGPIVWDIIHKAHLWSQDIGWSPGITDA
ncbi:GrpB family protein [Paenibacillus glycanilyticus]|uniref:GrpB family protein n=1 Tax=Paenibacillus glycanilyticus TaxID=126569 RepID=UPI00203F4BB4|nr:GrpB family protein [Paenibacillus glycanilyticus]MCM3628555.1 GrpB family protein [Paenibacillus glycanilyticus]